MLTPLYNTCYSIPIHNIRESVLSTITQAVHSSLLKDKAPVKIRRAWPTALLSHLCLLIPPTFYLLALLFLHLLLFLLLPSAAEAV